MSDGEVTKPPMFFLETEGYDPLDATGMEAQWEILKNRIIYKFAVKSQRTGHFWKDFH